MRPLLFVVFSIASLSAHAEPVVSDACAKTIENALVDQMVSPCGEPEQGPYKNVIYFYYSENADGGSEYIPQKYCGFPTPGGLGRATVTYQVLVDQDCKVIDLSL